MENPATSHKMTVTTAIGKLRQRVQALIDGDLVLPTDGQSLLATLDAALEGMAAADTPAARAAMAEFTDRVQALTVAGLLEAKEAHLRMDAVTAVVAALCG